MTSSNQHENVSRSSRVDRLSVGKLVLDSEWRTYTPTLSTGAWGSTTTNRWSYKISGRTLSVKGTVQSAGGGTTGSGTYYFTLPTGCVGATFGVSGACTLVGLNKQFQGTIGQESGKLSQFYFSVVDPVSLTSTNITWGAGSDSEIRLNAVLGVYCSFEIELASTSPILQ